MATVTFNFVGDNPFKIYTRSMPSRPIEEVEGGSITLTSSINDVYFVPDGNEIISVSHDVPNQMPTRPIMAIYEGYVPSEIGGIGFSSELTVSDYVETHSPVTFTIVSTAKESESSSPATRLFSMDRENLALLANENLYTYSWGLGGEGTSKDSRMVDYIINLLMIPFEFPEEYKGTETNIKLGTYDLPIIAPILSSDLIEVSLGEIVVPEVGSSLDFEGVEYELFLPYVSDTVVLPNNLIVGKTIEVIYSIDLYSGLTTINIYNGGVDPIKSIKSMLGRDIPIKTDERSVVNIGDDSGIESGFNYIYFRKTSPELMGGIFNNLVSVNGLLSDVTGYAIVENMVLNTKANLNEQQQILNILKSGVIINE